MSFPVQAFLDICFPVYCGGVEEPIGRAVHSVLLCCWQFWSYFDGYGALVHDVT